ncbi:FAD-dependent 5-carboxymethylaminomethyl-2-thiouridine(34) oxidoreductase MnmC [SAR92 clade bacterium H246]|jgi:tRNA 5-methylaminomethyl-2-thiouridine biosynthesis bifunctional protein
MPNPWHLNGNPTGRSTREIAILGAGIAGCTAAAALAKRGFKVSIVDRHQSAGCEASGNSQGIVYPKLSPRDDFLPRINLAAIKWAADYYSPFWQQGLGSQCGIVVLPENDRAQADFNLIGEQFSQQPDLVQLCNNQQLCQLSGITLQAETGLYFPALGWLPPAQICQQLLARHQIPVIQADVDRIVHADGRWSLIGADGECCFASESLVIANAYGCEQFEQTRFLPVTQLRGQISELQANASTCALKTVICGAGYITPEHNGQHSFGATYNKGVFTTQVRREDHQVNLDHMSATDTGLASAIGPQDVDIMAGRANYRCTTKDYLPIVGAVPDVPQLMEDYAILRNDARARVSTPGSYLPNLYINCGMGSRGLSYAPLTAEILACDIAGETSGLEQDLRLAMHPARFIIRDLKKKRI